MEQEKPQRSIGLTPAQVAGSALAAVSAALLASFAGTTGTIIGAAVGSVVATVGAATYTWSLRRTSEVVRRTAAQVRQTALLTGPLPRSVAQGPLRPGDRRKSGNATPDASAEPSEDNATAPADDALGKGLPWVKVLIASVAVTVVALGGITAVEAITGKPVSSWFGNNSGTGTSVSHLLGSDSGNSGTKTPAKKVKKTPVPSQTPSPAAPAAPTTPTTTNLPSTPPQQQPQPSAPAPSTLP